MTPQFRLSIMLLVSISLLTPVASSLVSPSSASSTPGPMWGRGYLTQIVTGGGHAYVSYQPSILSVAIADFNDGLWRAPVVMGSVSDSHGNGFLLRTSTGMLHYFYGAYESDILYKRSQNPDDTSAWETMAHPMYYATYPTAFELTNGTIILLYRYALGGTHWQYLLSTTGGDSWSDPHEFLTSEFNDPDLTASYPGFYLEQTATREIFHIAWNEHNYTSGVRENLYYASMNLTTGNLSRADGTNLGDCVEYAEMESCMIYDSGIYGSWYPAIDSRSGQTIITWACMVGASSTSFKMARWTGSTWTITDIATGHYNSGCSVPFIQTDGDIRVYYQNDSGTTGSLYRKTYHSGTFGSAELLLNYTETEGGLGLYPIYGPLVFSQDRETIAVGQSDLAPPFHYRTYVYSSTYGWLVNGTSIEPFPPPYDGPPIIAGQLALVGFGIVVAIAIIEATGLGQYLRRI